MNRNISADRKQLVHMAGNAILVYSECASNMFDLDKLSDFKSGVRRKVQVWDTLEKWKIMTKNV